MEFGADLRWSWVMGGLARQIAAEERAVIQEAWLGQAARSGMPVDTRLWTEGPIASTYPACMAVKAAAEQAADGGYAYLRALREGLLCLRRKLDTSEALVEEAKEGDLASAVFIAEDGSRHAAAPGASVAELRAAALAAGAEPSGAERPGVAEALGRFRRMAPVEVQAVCDLPEPRAHAELWGLALEWRARSQRVLTGRLWELA